MDLKGMRVLVVGASSGLGRASALHLVEQGARVVLAARREEALQAAVAEAKGEAHALRCDVCDETSCRDLVRGACERLGGLDGLVYATGTARPILLAEAGSARWAEILETNLVGASLVTREALPHLEASRGRAIYLSSITAEDPVPRAGMALYAVSKAALNKLIQAWQGENPAVGFTRLQVGDTLGTGFGDGWTAEELGFVKDWAASGLMFGRTMKPQDVAEQIALLLTTREAVPSMTLQPRPAIDDFESMPGLDDPAAYQKARGKI